MTGMFPFVLTYRISQCGGILRVKGVSMRLVSIAILGILLISAQVGAEDQAVLKTQKDKTSYALGADLARNLKRQSVDIDPDIVMRGMKDALSGGKTLMSDDEIRETLTAIRQQVMANQAKEMKEIAEKNKKEGEAFLKANKKKDGVKTLPSGLQYKVITAGTGKSPKPTDTVTVNYRGTLIDGTEFDSSYKHGQPATFQVDKVIRGWQEALPLMKEGAKWQLFIPPDLAYGERGAGTVIGPNSTLIFEVELIAVK
jgi:FKBP-type peptidyl-prolyl cis-trans isomerase FklB